MPGGVGTEGPPLMPRTRRASPEANGVFTPLKPSTLASRVSRDLLAAIVSGKFKPGEFLPAEESLCEEFGVSRPIIREAMKSLVGVGVVRTRQGQGSVVVDQDEWNEFSAELLIVRCETGAIHDVVHEVLELRIGLEASAAEAAAVRAKPVDIQVLRKHVDAMQNAKDTDEFMVHDIAFHQEILRIAGNRLVVKLFALLDPMLRSARALTLEHQKAPTSILRGVAEHRKILEAVARHSPDQARAASIQHVALIGHRFDEYETSLVGPKAAPRPGRKGATGKPPSS